MKWQTFGFFALCLQSEATDFSVLFAFSIHIRDMSADCNCNYCVSDFLCTVWHSLKGKASWQTLEKEGKKSVNTISCSATFLFKKRGNRKLVSQASFQQSIIMTEQFGLIAFRRSLIFREWKCTLTHMVVVVNPYTHTHNYSTCNWHTKKHPVSVLSLCRTGWISLVSIFIVFAITFLHLKLSRGGIYRDTLKDVIKQGSTTVKLSSLSRTMTPMFERKLCWTTCVSIKHYWIPLNNCFLVDWQLITSTSKSLNPHLYKLFIQANPFDIVYLCDW